ncbi:MAG: metallophosphoesterase family protein [Verrucomicrobiaceae bacterium]|nr:metallophosphoesterase family protein [Verrucomicrobiaceae bacterium]
MTIPSLLKTTCSTTLLALAMLQPLAAKQPTFSRSPYLQLATESSIRIVWRTERSITPVVRYGKDPATLTMLSKPEHIVTRTTDKGQSGGPPPLHSAPDGTRQFEATISGLEPAATYYYAIYDGEKRLTPEDATYRFKTHPVPGTERPLYFWVVGDSGTGGANQAKVHTAMRDYNKAQKSQLDLYIHVGDMAYGSGTDTQFSERFFRMYEPTLRNTVCWAAMGNHEGKTSKGKDGTGPFYDAYICPTTGEAGGLPSGKEAYYSFDFGNVHFIVLDSHDLDRRPGGAMARWLKADIEKTKAEWLIAYFHHPPYTKGSHDSDKESQLIEMREHIMPILEGGGVDIVFTGHSHIYERSMLIDGAYKTPTTASGVVLDDGDGDPEGDGPYLKSKGLVPHNGTIQVVAGHGGTNVSRKGTMPVMRRIIVENGSVLVSVEGNTLSAKMLNLNATVRDSFAIKKEGVIEHSPIKDPWQPQDKNKAKNPEPVKAPKKGNSLPAVSHRIIDHGAQWRYLAGGAHPPEKWTTLDFNHSSWQKGAAGFGYGDKDDRTELIGMRDKYRSVYIRSTFQVPPDADRAKIGIAMSYDDAFIAYINGKEILRVGVDSGSGKGAKGFHSHEADKKFEFFPLDKHAIEALQEGVNILAIEGHNVKPGSSDFTLHPALLLAK